MAKLRWIIERDYQELKQELGSATTKAADGGAFTITPPYDRGLWFRRPNGIFFSLSASAPGFSAPNRRRTSARFAAFVPSGITRVRSQPSG
jgi:hypothetical protein